MLSLCFWVTLLFAILYAMASMDVTGQCYCDPCSSSSPAITNGLSIVTAMGAFLFIAQVWFLLFQWRFVSSITMRTLAATHPRLLLLQRL